MFDASDSAGDEGSGDPAEAAGTTENGDSADSSGYDGGDFGGGEF